MTISSPTKIEAVHSGLQNGDLELSSDLDSLAQHFDLTEPNILAFIEEDGRFERLQREAQALSRQASSRSKFPLYGIPVGVKDIFHVDGFETQAGSKLPSSILQGPQADSVSRLKAAGALIMGKTATTEFAYFAPGPTRNPHNPKHTPGGSSSGSAAAVAAGMLPLALGTQTVGSVIRPASFCGVIGFKPSYDRISRAGVIPLSHSLDHVGTFANSLWLTEKAASVLIADWRSNVTRQNRPILGIPAGDYLNRADKAMQKHFMSVVSALKKAGYIIRERELFPNYDQIAARHTLILDAEGAQVHAGWYRFHSAKYHQRTREMIERGMQINSNDLATAKKQARHFGQSVSSLMDIHGIDLWLAPAAPGAAPKGLESTGDPVMNLPWTQSALPVLGLPSGKDANSLPLGIQFVADFGRDEELLFWANDIQQVITGTPS